MCHPLPPSHKKLAMKKEIFSDLYENWSVISKNLNFCIKKGIQSQTFLPLKKIYIYVKISNRHHSANENQPTLSMYLPRNKTSVCSGLWNSIEFSVEFKCTALASRRTKSLNLYISRSHQISRS